MDDFSSFQILGEGRTGLLVLRVLWWDFSTEQITFCFCHQLITYLSAISFNCIFIWSTMVWYSRMPPVLFAFMSCLRSKLTNSSIHFAHFVSKVVIWRFIDNFHCLKADENKRSSFLIEVSLLEIENLNHILKLRSLFLQEEFNYAQKPISLLCSWVTA